jgi:hypothetical protein
MDRKLLATNLSPFEGSVPAFVFQDQKEHGRLTHYSLTLEPWISCATGLNVPGPSLTIRISTFICSLTDNDVVLGCNAVYTRK